MTVSLAHRNVRTPARRQPASLPLTSLDTLLQRDPAGEFGAAAEGRAERRTALRSLTIGVAGMAAVVAVAAIGVALAVVELIGSLTAY